MADKKKEITKMQLAVYGWIREQVEDKKNIPIVIKNLIEHFSSKVFSTTKILSMKEDLDLAEVISLKLNFLKIKKYKLLFRASEKKYSAKEFHKACDRECENFPTVLIVKSDIDNKFGGYTSKSWLNKSESFYHQDPSAFLFISKSDDEQIQAICPLIFDIKEEEKQWATCCVPGWGPAFGDGLDLFIDNAPEDPVYNKPSNSSTLKSYYNENYAFGSLCGGNTILKTDKKFENAGPEYSFNVEEYEVYQVIVE